ncbi:MAG: LPS assembly lipoprotein LptE [Puniceicoccaceae bacterium]
MTLPRLPPVALLILLTISSGCAHYQLGGGSSEAPTYVFLEPLQTAVFVSRTGADLARQVRDSFAGDLRYRLAAHPDQADYRLSLTVEGYNQQNLSGFSQDTGKPISTQEEFSLRLEVLSFNPNQKEWLPFASTSVQGAIYTYARTSGSFQEARHQTGASVQRDLASRVVDRFTDLIGDQQRRSLTHPSLP